MKQELLEQLDGYDKVKQEIEISRKFGDDFSLEKGQVAKIVNRLHPSQIKLCVSRIIEETVSTKTIRLTAVNGYLPPFQAGQYISLSVEVDKVRTGRAYSISSSPSQTGYYDITVRHVENGRVSNFFLDKVKVGDIFIGSGPQGHFELQPDPSSRRVGLPCRRKRDYTFYEYDKRDHGQGIAAQDQPSLRQPVTG